jgi:hypothetical protein
MVQRETGLALFVLSEILRNAKYYILHLSYGSRFDIFEALHHQYDPCRFSIIKTKIIIQFLFILHAN